MRLCLPFQHNEVNDRIAQPKYIRITKFFDELVILQVNASLGQI